jgi:NADH dehydrogenase [ubiquinone] 1 alpha subcomplex assembly factor 7
MSLADFMASANATYYATRDPLGASGDFITAPEISQMFGELVGLWLADMWLRMNKPRIHYVELGPGRGTLARDALRAMAQVGLKPEVHLVETSPELRQRQAELLPGARWYHDLGGLPTDAPLFVVANEFFDALPIHQLVKAPRGWCQRVVGLEDGNFAPGLGNQVPIDIVPSHLRGAEMGSVIETCPAAVRIMSGLGQQISAQGGIGLVIDYGYSGPALGDTFQAVKAHQFADPFADPGQQDLTAHVDFETLGAAAEMGGARVQGPAGQGAWLTRLGLIERTLALSEVHPEHADRYAGERDRLAGLGTMGRLFKVMAFRHPDWPESDGF